VFTLTATHQFEKDYKLCKKRNLKILLIEKVFELLGKTGSLTAKYKSHKLRGNYEGFWECHIQPDWLLIWSTDVEQKEIQLIRTGTHSDLF